MLSSKPIPDIKEWFTGLSVDDRVACFTIIDDHWADTVLNMQAKNNQHGYGIFKYQSVHERREIVLPNREVQEITHSRQEHKYFSI